MSDNIPFEIQTEIIKNVPVKSLLQFRSVSKTWKSLIDSSHFIKTYSSQRLHLLVYYDHANKYVSIVDDHTFPHQKVSVTIPVKPFEDYDIIGCSHGLLCLYDGRSSRTEKAVIWNISVRKAVEIVLPELGFGMNRTVGFGVARETNDPKIVKITYSCGTEGIAIVPWQVEIFTLSTGAWRRLYRNLPRKSNQFVFLRKGVAVDGVLYWLAYDRITMDKRFTGNISIISFDLTSEEFIEVNLPDSLAQKSHFGLLMSELRESLVVLEFGEVSVIWMLEDGVPKSFTKLFTINIPEDTFIRGFRKNGEHIIEIRDQEDNDVGQLAVYEPNSKNMDNIGIDKPFLCSIFVYPYKETLLLLDQSPFTVYTNV